MKHAPSVFLRFASGLILIAATAALYLWQKDIDPLNPKVINSMVLVALAYTLATVSVNKLIAFPGRQTWLHILPTVGIAYSGVFALFALFFVTFSNSFVLFNAIITGVFFYLDFLLRSRREPLMAYIPTGRAAEAATIPHARWLRLDEPVLPQQAVRAVVADLHSSQLGGDWQKFIATCTLQGIAVYNIRQVEESLTGRVKIRHLYENDLGSLLPSPGYMLVKRVIDILLVLFSLPLTLPLMAATALAIRLESPGGALFTQNRVGQGGREFKIYKFRSMCADSEKDGARLAQEGDARVTRVGRFIRKTRLDELPQFFNILKGDMSLIGPRPEQRVFVEQFNQRIPF